MTSRHARILFALAPLIACGDPLEPSSDGFRAATAPPPDELDPAELHAALTQAREKLTKSALGEVRTDPEERFVSSLEAWTTANSHVLEVASSPIVHWDPASDYDGPPTPLSPVDEIDDGDLPPPVSYEHYDFTDPAPCDLPPRGWPRYRFCTDSEEAGLEEIWNRTHFATWRALQRLHWVLETDDDALAAYRWSMHAVGSDSAPEQWFGAFDRGRAEAITETLEKGWAQLRSENYVEHACYQRLTPFDWLFPPLMAAKIGSPCTYSWLGSNDVVAHAIYAFDPKAHPGLGFPAYEFCNRFFEKYEDIDDPLDVIDGYGDDYGYLSSIMLHESLHVDVGVCSGFPDPACDPVPLWPPPAFAFPLSNALGTVKDTHKVPACGGDKKCYGSDEAQALGASFPDRAARSPSSYQYFVERTGELYISGGCDDFGNVCFGPAPWIEACQPPALGCTPAASGGCTPGEPGCGCLDVEGGSLTAVLEGVGPDGGGSDLAGAPEGQYCPGDDVVCGECGGTPTCQTCGEDTLLGCPCDADEQCTGLGDDYACWGGRLAGWPNAPDLSGKCLPAATTADGREALEEMPWFCLDNCAAIDAYQGWGMACDHGTCVHILGGCEPYANPGECEASGGFCEIGDAQVDPCVAECDIDTTCGSRRFPEDYVCTDPVAGRCVPQGCQGGGPGFCGLF
jgi:hypothetical protein